MKILDVGHKFILASFDGKHKQVLQFMKRKGLKFPGNNNSYPGTTTQDVIHCLLNRTRYVQNQIPCVENEVIINNLQICLLMLEQRAAKRHGYEFEALTLREMEFKPMCPKCGHTVCEHKI